MVSALSAKPASTLEGMALALSAKPPSTLEGMPGPVTVEQSAEAACRSSSPPMADRTFWVRTDLKSVQLALLVELGGQVPRLVVDKVGRIGGRHGNNLRSLKSVQLTLLVQLGRRVPGHLRSGRWYFRRRGSA